MKKNLIKPVDLKLARAAEQARNICAEIDKWSALNQIKFKMVYRENRLGYKIVVEDFDASDFTNLCGLLAGELMHNLRSALDNLAYGLACIKQDPPASPGQISFPICQDQASFFPVKQKLTAQLPKDAVTLIEMFQPFNRLKPEVDGSPDTDPLVHLQWYNNVDKHRVPSVVLIAPSGEMQSSMNVEFHSVQDASANVPPRVEIFGHPLHPNMTIWEHITNHPLKSVQGNLNYGVIVSIQGKNAIDPLAPSVQQLHYYIALLVEHFRPLFQD